MKTFTKLFVLTVGLVTFVLCRGLCAEKTSACTVQPPEAFLNPAAVQKGTHHFELRPNKPNTAPEAIEWAMLVSSIPVVIESGGCAHWGEVYRFILGGKLPKNTSTWLKKASELLTQLALASRHPSRIPDMASRLAQRANQKPRYKWRDSIPVIADRPDYGGIVVSTATLIGGTAQLEIRASITPQI